MSKSRAGKKMKRRRPPRAPKTPPKQHPDDFAEHVERQLKARQVDGAKATTIRTLKLAMCHARNRGMEGRPVFICGCGAVAAADGTMKCRGLPPDQWFDELLEGKVRARAEDARRGDAAPLR
jgi:hypothetical protein